jgi:hypothetical protein
VNLLLDLQVILVYLEEVILMLFVILIQGYLLIIYLPIWEETIFSPIQVIGYNVLPDNTKQVFIPSGATIYVDMIDAIVKRVVVELGGS